MAGYPLTWITPNIAVGHAPMSYEELGDIKNAGIDAIVNLCGEFCDLHEIEEKAGFEVLWLPVADESAPAMKEMEKGLEWLDEAVYLGKKVLIHCHHGIGRTGTFITAYLLRRGFGLKKAEQLLKATRANPTNFSQWWMLRKFGRKEGQLKIGDPTPENRNGVDLSDFYLRYESLRNRIDALPVEERRENGCPCFTFPDGQQKCRGPFALELIEALYLNHKVNVVLKAEQRQEVIAQAKEASAAAPCPLLDSDFCLLHDFRPLHCRLRHLAVNSEEIAVMRQELALLSGEVFHTLFGFKNEKPPLVNMRDSISGKFVESYFRFLMESRKKTDE